jgi:glutamate N-acetyltransferase/amino-acid N-acetyltransferase
MTRLVGEACQIDAAQVLVLSTGIIGEHLPMEKISRGITQAAQQLGREESHLSAMARAMMTTDTRPKLAGCAVACDHDTYQITGLAKGAAMIGPRMATMLAVVLTDASLAVADAQSMLAEAVEDSFNCISVEGHMSTNDSVLLLSSGARQGPHLSGADFQQFRHGLKQVCVELARSIPDDGEGATHLIEIHVTGCRQRDDAKRIAKAIANSPLVKTAIAGADPNWGRIVSAAGDAGVSFEPTTVRLRVNDWELFQEGSPLPFDAEQVSQSIRDHRTTRIELDLGQGEASVRFWTCDLTSEYVRLNADYHT